jgi:endonuclease-3
VRVNLVTPALFAKYRTAADYAAADPTVLQQEIHSTGFFRNKTKSLIGLGQALVERHGGAVPDTMDDLVRLPGVGRKTANVVLGTWFRKNEGVVVDTHVHRLATLLQLTREKTPEKIERELMDVVPRAKWTVFSHLLILHGRAVCIARRPRCESCVVNRWCPSSSSARSAVASEVARRQSSSMTTSSKWLTVAYARWPRATCSLEPLATCALGTHRAAGFSFLATKHHG